MMSRQALIREAQKNSYKPENLEKVNKLLFVLEQLMSVPFLKERLVLKGGTALNLFYFEPVPRLSVDIDLNYIGHIDRSVMLEERKLIEESINKILLQYQFEPSRSPTQHAGGKNVWRYDSVLGQKGNLEIDLNYMFRKPFWPIMELGSKLNLSNPVKVPVLDIHELASGKLAALFARRVSRDFFDAHQLLTKCNFDMAKLRQTFVIYACLSDASIKDISIDAIHYDLNDIRNKLFPVLRQDGLPKKRALIENWANQLLSELKEGLTSILPLRNNEIEFITLIREHGQIKPEAITNSEGLIEAVLMHPLINWKANKATKVSTG